MGSKSNRNKPPRSRNPLLVSASAITRAIDPAEPSRVTVLHLLGDALQTFQESQLVVDQIKSRTVSYTSRNASPPSRHQLEADSRVRQAHEQGARALFTAAASALIKLPSRAGPLRRRAVDLFTMTGRAAGPAVVMQAAENCRSHIASLKRLTWSDAERGDFEVVCAILTLADMSNCAIAGREIAKDSVQFLLGQKVKHKCRRGDLAHAIAMIVQSFPVHAPPDDRMVDTLLDFALSSSAIKHGDCGVGSALLVAIVAPLLVSRGSRPADDVTLSCGRAMKATPIATERAMWGVAMARASVTAKRSRTYQLRKYGNSEASSKFSVTGSSLGQLSQKFEKDPGNSNASAWVSNETFELALLHVADIAGLDNGRVDAIAAVASVLRMWVQALPDNDIDIVPHTFAKLLSGLSTVSAVSAVVDAVWLGVLKDLKPSRSPTVFEKLLPLLSSLNERNDLQLSAVLHVCSAILFRYGRQCIRETGLTTEYGAMTTLLIKRAHEALDVASHFVRIGGVQLMCALTTVLPRTCSQFVTAILQNLRIADLTLATSEPSSMRIGTFADLNSIEHELSSVLGNSSALSALIGKVTSGELSVPAALVRQCRVDSLALLRPHPASTAADVHRIISGCIRRRAGWGLVAALAHAKQKNIFEGKTLVELISLWKGELGFVGEKGERNIRPSANPEQPFDPARSILADEHSSANMDELLAMSSTRSAALHALLCALRNACSEQLLQCAKALLGACAARIIATQAMYGASASQGVLWGGIGLTNTSETGIEKQRNLAKLARFLAVESVHLLQCVTVIPPRGDVAELCYFIALSLGEEAERVGGESEIGSVSDTTLSNALASVEKGFQVEATMTNRKHCLTKLISHHPATNDASYRPQLRRQSSKIYDSRRPRIDANTDTSWIFSMQGVKPLLAEEVLFHSTAAIAAIVSEDLSASGSLVESLSISKLSACSSAIIALEMSRRLSRSDLAEINRCLALLQVLAKRSLRVTGGCQKAIVSESRDGRLFIPQLRGDSMNLEFDDVPGVALQRLGESEGWTQWARGFSSDGLLWRVPFHDFHLRAIGIMHASRSIAAEAHREIGMTGGPRLWVGMMRRVITVIKENLASLSPLQTIMLSNGLAALGALLEVTPDSILGLKGMTNETDINKNANLSVDVDEIGNEAINVLVDVIERGNIDAREAAALALSSCSHRIAASSERLLGALFKAWTDERGEFSKMGYFGRCASEAEVWASCFAHIWRDMGVRLADSKGRFFSHGSCGLGSCSAALMTGATAVLSSCRMNWWAMTESHYSTVLELSVELLQWTGGSSHKSRAAGLYGITALWASRIEEARVRHLSCNEDSMNSHGFTGVLPDDMTSLAPVLPVQAFSLKDPSRFTSAVGPFLDEVLYDALVPQDTHVVSEELQTAATAAITEIIRGAGVYPTCLHLPRLPEVLFAADSDGSLEARRLIMVLVKCDAQRRPRYWFGLCRAICLRGERLHHGSSKSTWDVSSRTRAFSVRVAAEAIDHSLASCDCLAQRREAPLGSSKHVCAYGFIRKVFEFVEVICNTGKHDCSVCEEVCNLVQRIALRIGSVPPAWKETDAALKEYRDVWDNSLSSVEGLLSDDAPHTVVNNAAWAMSELLLSFVRLCHFDIFASVQGKVLLFLEKLLSSNLRTRFLYSDQSEEIGTSALFGLITNYSRVVTYFQANAQKRGYVSKDYVPTLHLVKKTLLAVVGDFVVALSGDGLRTVAIDGGALISEMLSEKQLENLFLLHMPPIILGAVSCAGYMREQSEKVSNAFWANPNAAGVLMTEEFERFSNVPVCCFVWLLKHEHKYMRTLSKTSSFQCQSPDALINICCSKKSLNEHVKELIVSFAQCGKETFFNFLSSFTVLNHVDPLTAMFVVELAQDLLRDMMNEEMVADFEANLRAICKGIAALSKSVKALSEKDSIDTDALATRMMETMMIIVQTQSEDAEDCYEDLRFQRVVCECISSCFKVLNNPERAYAVWLREIIEIFWRGHKQESLSRMKVSMAMGVTICELIGAAETIAEFSQVLLTPLPNETRADEKCLVLDIALECHGIEEFIVNVLTGQSSSESFIARTSFALMYELGRLVLSTRPCCVPAMLQISIAAIRIDCENDDIVNRVGLLLYSICLSKLIRSLPETQQSSAENQLEIPQSAAFLLHLTASDTTMLRSMVPLLGAEEREIVKSFLQVSENRRKVD